MSNQATLTIGDKDFPLNVLVGTENEHALDISTLRKNSKYITFDDGYSNTGSCESEITFIDGDKGMYLDTVVLISLSLLKNQTFWNPASFFSMGNCLVPLNWSNLQIRCFLNHLCQLLLSR